MSRGTVEENLMDFGSTTPDSSYESFGVTADQLSGLTTLALRIGNALGLSSEHKAVLTHFTLPTGVQLKAVEQLNALAADVAALKSEVQQMQQVTVDNPVLTATQKVDINNACKLITYVPSRTKYDNDSILIKVLRYLKDNCQKNSFTAHFANPTSTFDLVLKKAIRQSALYAKNIIKDKKWFETTLGVTAEGVTRSANIIAEAMVGTKDNVGIQHINRLLMMRYFIRRWSNVEHGIMDISGFDDDEFFERASKTETEDHKPDFWRDADNFLAFKTEGVVKQLPKKDRRKKRKMAEEPQQTAKAFGSCFKSKEWLEFYEQRVAFEIKIFPEDKIPKIPQKESTPATPTPTSLSIQQPIPLVMTGHDFHHQLCTPSNNGSTGPSQCETPLNSSAARNGQSLPPLNGIFQPSHAGGIGFQQPLTVGLGAFTGIRNQSMFNTSNGGLSLPPQNGQMGGISFVDTHSNFVRIPGEAGGESRRSSSTGWSRAGDALDAE
ncbi:hypothetical protein EV360DRAFT_86559 [Lentinula raphanica]|nr:hypothetical protein EV360DRAFT_86559 [Lentinula raphanica]